MHDCSESVLRSSITQRGTASGRHACRCFFVKVPLKDALWRVCISCSIVCQRVVGGHMCAAQVEGRDAGRYIGWRSRLPFYSDQLVRELRDALPPFRAVASPGEIASEAGALMLTHRCSCFSGMAGGPVRLLRHPHAFVGIHAGSNRMPCPLLHPQISPCYGCAASCLMRVTFACVNSSSHRIHMRL